MKLTLTTALRLIASLSMLAVLFTNARDSDTDLSNTATSTLAVYALVFGIAGISGVVLFLFFNAVGVLIITATLTLLASAAVIVSLGGEQDDTDEKSTSPDYIVDID